MNDPLSKEESALLAALNRIRHACALPEHIKLAKQYLVTPPGIALNEAGVKKLAELTERQMRGTVTPVRPIF